MTFWMFGLTAMTLVFASLLLMGLLMRSGVVDAGIQGAVTAYAALIAGIGLAGAAYVLAIGRRQGIFGSLAKAPPGPVPLPDRVIVAPVVLPRLPRHRQELLMREREMRSRQARAIAAATARPGQGSRAATARSTPSISTPGMARPSMPPGASAGQPQGRYAVSPYARTSSTQATPRAAAPRPVPPPRQPLPTVPRTPVPPSTGPSPVAASGLMPSKLTMNPPAMTPRVQATALQLRTAGLRGPAAATVPHPALSMPSPIPGHPPTPGPMRHPVALPTPRQPIAPEPGVTPVAGRRNDARLATPSGRGAAW